jgi:hypothetical protein
MKKMEHRESNLIEDLKSHYPDTARQIKTLWQSAKKEQKTAFADSLLILLRRARREGIEEMRRKEAKDDR